MVYFFLYFLLRLPRGRPGDRTIVGWLLERFLTELFGNRLCLRIERRAAREINRCGLFPRVEPGDLLDVRTVDWAIISRIKLFIKLGMISIYSFP